MASNAPAGDAPIDDSQRDGTNLAVGARVDWARALVEHRAWLRSVVLARVGDAHAADDVLQEVALAATKQGPRLSDASKVAPWLYRVAVRQSLVHRRTAGRRRKRQEEFRRRAEASPPDEQSADPLKWLLSRERREMVKGAMDRLDDRDAEILFLKYAEDWSYQQIAANLGVSQSAVESRLHRARRKLRKALAAME